MTEPDSRMRGNLTEIVHLVPIREGLVPLEERGQNSAPITFADRLKIILETFNRSEDAGFPNVIRFYGGIHTAKWALIDGDSRLLLSVVFDGNWYDYLRALALEVPAFLHLIWSNTVGWRRVDNNPDALFAFIKAFQVHTSFLYAHHPQLTVSDVNRLIDIKAAVDSEQAVGRAQTYQRVAKTSTMAVQTLEEIRDAMLAEKGVAAVRASQAAFQAVIGRLYSGPDCDSAVREGFASKPSAGEASTSASKSLDVDTRGLSDLQTSVLRGYTEAVCARMYLLHFTDRAAARAWLKTLPVSFGDSSKAGANPKEKKAGSGRPPVQLAFTFAGLEVLTEDAASLSAFPYAFRTGMRNRGERLGDGPFECAWKDDAGKHPAGCRMCGVDEAVHAVLIAYDVREKRAPALERALREAGRWARDEQGAARPEHDQVLADQLRDELDEVTKLAAGVGARPAGVEVLATQDLHRPLVPDEHGNGSYGIEYFGFKEGVLGPKPGLDAPWSHFVVDASSHPLLNRGSYFVMRQLEQDPKTFWGGVTRALESSKGAAAQGCPAHAGAATTAADQKPNGHRGASEPEPSPEVALAQVLMGITRTGQSLGDKQTCPFQGHVSRVNPHPGLSAARNPRIIRRGMSYLDRDHKRGLMFMAYVADIESQFEFVQRRWIQAANHVGGSTQDHDPVIGSPIASKFDSSASLFTDTFDGRPVAANFAPSVRLRWGEYFFAPSAAGLEHLLRLPSDASVASHHPTIFPFEKQYQDAKEAGAKQALVRAWLDDASTATKFWDWVRERGGLRVELCKPMAGGATGWVFATHPTDVAEVMGDDGRTFSVREYGRRMVPTTGKFFLGMDAYTRDYREEELAVAIVPQAMGDVQKAARQSAEAFLAGWVATTAAGRLTQDPKQLEPAKFPFLLLVGAVLDGMATRYFGLPGPSTFSLAQWGLDIVSYHFRIDPDAIDLAKVRQSSADYAAHVHRSMQLARCPSSDPTTQATRNELRRKLDELAGILGMESSEDDLARNLIGILTGSLGATITLVLNALTAYTATHRGNAGFTSMPSGANLFEDIVAQTLIPAELGGPDALYRQYALEEPRRLRTKSGDQDSQVQIQKDDLVVAWLGGALRQDARPNVVGHGFFGYGQHQCPGANMAMGLISGMFDALATLDLKLAGVEEMFNVELAEESLQRLVTKYVPPPPPGPAAESAQALAARSN